MQRQRYSIIVVGGIDMKRISRAVLISAVILAAAFWTNPTDAGKKQPADPLSRTLQEAGLKQLEDEVVRQIGQAIEVGAPLRLDQRIAFPPTTIDNFQPKTLDLSRENMNRPLEPGDYSIPVIGYCTKWSLHYPGRGLPYKLAPLQGRHAEIVGALLQRGTQQGLNPRHLNAMAWRIQGGVPISQWRPAERELAHQLIPEHESELDGDFLEQTRATYEKTRQLGKLPPYETTLGRLGAVGQTVLDLQRARKVLANQTLAAERMPDLLYGRPRDGLPRTLTAGPNEPLSPWAEIRPGVFARVTIMQGNMGRNVLDVRITPEARTPSAANHLREEFAVRPVALTANLREDVYPTLEQWFIYVSGLIAYPEGRPAQALILVPLYGCCGIRG
jgi:hypothetical protein